MDGYCQAEQANDRNSTGRHPRSAKMEETVRERRPEQVRERARNDDSSSSATIFLHLLANSEARLLPLRLSALQSPHRNGWQEKTSREIKKPGRNSKEGDASGAKEDDKKEVDKLDLSAQQTVAVLGIALIAMGKDIGSQMCLRMFGHLVRYGEPIIRRAVPLTLATISISHPRPPILESPSKFSHDADADTAHNAVFAMDLVGVGTNNAKLVSMLRQLASYHHRDQVSVMLVRLTQGVTHMGKGTVTLNPLRSDRQLTCPAAVAGLFAVCFAFPDANNSVLNDRQHYLLSALALPMQSRLLITLIQDDSDPDILKQVNVSVRVGQAVDVVAQVGKPKAITSFQTHTTPVLLSHGERAELANDEHIPLTPYLEGLVIVRKNAEYVPPMADSKRK